MTSKWSGRSVDALVGAFLQIGKTYQELWGPEDVEHYNRVEHEMHEIGAALKAAGEEGKKALLSLMTHEHLPIRLKAAKISLSFAKDEAAEVLTDICEMNAGTISAEAMTELIVAGEYDLRTGPKRRPNRIPSEELNPKGPSRPKK
jgi:hypothetical protein